MKKLLFHLFNRKQLDNTGPVEVYPKSISDWAHAMEKFTATEEVYRDLFENSLVAMFSTELSTFKTISVNEVGAELFGYKTKEEFLKNFDPLVHFVDPHEREKNIKTVKAEGQVKSKIQEMKKLDGTLFWAQLFIKANSENKMAHTMVIDITAQKKLEEKNKNLSKRQ